MSRPDDRPDDRHIVIVGTDFAALELRALALMLGDRRREVPTIHIDQIHDETRLAPGTLVFGDKFMEVFATAGEYYEEFKQSLVQMFSKPLTSEMLGPWNETYRLRLPEPMPVNHTPKPMKEPHRSDWAQRRPRRRRRK